MALRTMLSNSQCVLRSNQICWKDISQVSKSIRGFKRLRDGSKIDSSFSSELVPLSGRFWKPFGFTILIGSASHIGATIWEYERIRSQTYGFINRYNQWRINRTGWRGELQNWWNGLSTGQKVFVPICFLNCIVCLCWKVPAWQPTMTRLFCTNPASKNCWPMILSSFSHHSILHLAVNMYVLHSFCTPAVAALGREQFVALYLTSAVTSSFSSHLYKILFNKPGLSLGASGAIMGVVSFICLQYPETKLSIAFLPMVTFTAGNAIKGLLLMDTVGCLAGWKFLDHAAHLGGALWGIFWQQWGNSHLWQKREPVLTFWHSIREPPKKS